MNFVIKPSRKFASSFAPVTRFSSISYPQKGGAFKFLGIVKNKPHYLNEDNEVYTMKSSKMDYRADWDDEFKMLWTTYPVTYHLITFKNRNYFYDIEDKDAYYYDKDMELVVPYGFYNQKTHTFNSCLLYTSDAADE